MENPLSKEQDQSKVIKVSFGSQLGPALLMGSFAVLLLKCAPHYWPIGLTAFLGYLTTQYLKKRGLFLSLFILAAVLLLLLRTGAELFWPLLLAGSISVSWALIFLGGQEASSIQSQKDEKILALAKQSQELEKQLREAKIAISKESKDLILEKERLNAQLSVSLTQCNQLQSTLQIAEREREKLNEKCDVLSQDIFAYQRKEVAFQHALEDAQTQLLKMKGQLATLLEPKEIIPTLIPMEETDPEEKVRIEQVQHQYANLREQFEEKSGALNQARKELFLTENALLTLQKTIEEQANELSDADLGIIRDLKTLEEERRDLEAQVTVLQDFITALLAPSKKRSTRSKKSAEELPLILQEKIERAATSKSAKT